jgi:ketosteroid isomerase-like protein
MKNSKILSLAFFARTPLDQSPVRRATGSRYSIFSSYGGTTGGPMYFWSRLFAVVLLASAGSAQASVVQSCAPKDADPVQTVRQLYAAVTRGDTAAVSRMFAPGFYVFDHGRRMTGAELASQVDEIRKQKIPYIWTVEDAEGHVTCDTAWVTYKNRHIPIPGSNVLPKDYLESVVLIWLDGDWKLRFFHSTPAQ